MKRIFIIFLLAQLTTFGLKAQEQEYKQAFRINPVRLITGTFQLEYERELTDGFTASIMPMGTYAVDNGLGGWYVNALNKTFASNGDEYSPKIMAGLGLIGQGRFHLYGGMDEPNGIYAGPHLMFRKLWINAESGDESISESLNAFAGGAVLGVQFPVLPKVVIDAYAGPVMRVSSYSDENGVSQYNSWTAIDHTGITLNFGVGIGFIN